MYFPGTREESCLDILVFRLLSLVTSISIYKMSGRSTTLRSILPRENCFSKVSTEFKFRETG